MKNSFLRNLICQPEEADFLKSYIDGQPEWFHQFSFDNGLRTPGRDPSPKKLHHLCLPESLKGETIIDIGAYEGFFSFHCEQRGANRVVACDRFVWDWPKSTALANFRAVHRAIGSKVEILPSNVEDLPSTTTEKFDIVLFLGVLYHAPDPIRYLNSVAKVTSKVLVLETFVDALHEDGPRTVLYEQNELNNDSSNWFGPNPAAIEIMLRRVGFKTIEFINMWEVNTRDRIEGRPALQGKLKTGRVVIHAYK